MRNETTTPKGTDNRVKVFISSRCEPKEKYGTFRRALKKLLTETNLCDVFIFGDGASTQTAEEYYLSHIPQSDVVIFFVDNDFEKKNSKKKVASPDGVLQEYQETKRQGKKYFFFYCGTDNNKTELQKEVEKVTNAPTWLKIDDFIKAADEIYEAVINDILQIYKNYCGGRLIKKPDDIQEEKIKPIGEANAATEASSSHVTEATSSEIPNDNVTASAITPLHGLDFNLFSQTYAVLAKALRYETPDDFKKDYNEPMQTSALDMAIAPLFAYIIGHGNKNAIDFRVLKTQVVALHSGIMAEFVAKRMEVIEKYVNGATFDDLRSSINGICDFAKTNHLPGWLLFDVLIDNRNINAMTAEQPWFEDQNWAAQEKIQEQLKEIKENYYPAIDRLVREIDSKCLDIQFKQKTERIGTRTFGERLWGMYDLIKTFVIAISNGSLVHTFCTATRLEKLLYSYMSKYSEREFYIEYVRVKLISAGSLKELEAAVRERLWNDFNAVEAKSIWDSVCNLPEYHSKTIVKYKSAKLLWDYFDEETFAQASQWLLKKYSSIIDGIKNESIERWGEDDVLFESLAAIASRLTKEKRYSIITNTPINVWHRPSAKWLFKIWLRMMDVESCDSDEMVNFSEILISIHESNIDHRNIVDFLNVAIRLILCDRVESEKYSEFKSFLEENYPEVIKDYTNPDIDARLTLRLDIIEKRIHISGMSFNDIVPFTEILNIISAKSSIGIPDALAKRMYAVAVSTIYSKNRYVVDEERLSAMKILMILIGRFGYDVGQLHQDIINFPKDNGIFSPFLASMPKAITAGVYLLKAILGTIRPAEFIPLFSSIQDDSNVYATIDVIRYWVRFCGKITKPSYVEAALQYVVNQLLGNERSSIRRIASLMLVELWETKYDKLALDMISQIIDAGVTGTGTEVRVGFSFADKTAKEVIISALHQFKRRNPKQVKFILAKAQVDTSWSVRNAVKNMEDQYLH